MNNIHITLIGQIKRSNKFQEIHRKTRLYTISNILYSIRDSRKIGIIEFKNPYRIRVRRIAP